MSQADPIVTVLINACRHVSDTSGWITSVRESLEGMNAAESIWKPGPEERSVWEIVLHMTAWTDWAAHFLRGQDIPVTDWPPVGETGSGSWERVRADLFRALADYEAAISAQVPEALIRPLTPEVTQTVGLAGFLSILIHNAYHAGQITKLRERWRSVQPTSE